MVEDLTELGSSVRECGIFLPSFPLMRGRLAERNMYLAEGEG